MQLEFIQHTCRLIKVEVDSFGANLQTIQGYLYGVFTTNSLPVARFCTRNAFQIPATILPGDHVLRLQKNKLNIYFRYHFPLMKLIDYLEYQEQHCIGINRKFLLSSIVSCFY